MRINHLISVLFIILLLISPSLTKASGYLPNYEVLNSDGDEINIVNLSSSKFMFLAMTTSCSSCKTQNQYIKSLMPSVDELHFFSIAIDPSIDDLSDLANYRTKNEIHWPIYLDVQGDLRIVLEINSYPQLFLVNENKEIVNRWIGLTTDDKLREDLEPYYEINTDKSNFVGLKIILHNGLFQIWILALLGLTIYKIYLSKIKGHQGS